MSETATAAPASGTRRETAPRPPVSREKLRARRDARAAWGLLTPALIILGIMVGYPSILMVIQSFTDYTVKNKVLGTLPNFIGLDNYIALFSESDFPAVLMRSLGLMVVLTALIITVGVLIAILMTRLSRAWRTVVSVGLLLAWAMPPLTATVVWGWIFDTQCGVVTCRCRSCGRRRDRPTDQGNARRGARTRNRVHACPRLRGASLTSGRSRCLRRARVRA